MRILIGMGHPKDVHFWKNIIFNLINNGHVVKILVWEKDITSYLLDVYGFEYVVMGQSQKGFSKKAYEMLKSDIKLCRLAKKFNPDILIAGAPYLNHISMLLRKPHLSITDTENARLIQCLSYPFSDLICTPSCFKKKFNPRKHVTFEGYLELAYLHPSYFKPDPSVLDDLGLSKDDKLIILRFVSWGASHDIGQRGFNDQEEIVNKLKNQGEIFISSETKLSKSLKKYQLRSPPEKMHDLLYYATLYIGEGASMASEAAILGTPAIYVNTQRLGYLDEQEEKYGLVFNFSNKNKAQEQAIKKAVELLEYKDLKNKCQTKRKKLLDEKIDVTKFMTEMLEKYTRAIEK